MRVLIIHMRYHPDPTGTAPLVTQLAEDLVEGGMKVQVVASLPHYGRKDIHPDYRQYQGRISSRVENGVEVIRTPVYLPRNPGTLQRAWNYLSYNLASILAGLRAGKVDLVLAVNPPITTTFSAWTVSILRGVPLVVGIQDVWPDCIIQVGKLKNKLLIAVSRVLEKVQYRLAKRIVVLSEGMRNNLLEKGVPEGKIALIPNWADPREVKPLPRDNAFYREHHLEGKFVALFSGNHGYISALESVIEAANLLRDDPEVLFLLAGEGSIKPDLMRQADDLGLENVRFLTTQPEKSWLEMLSAADLGLVPLQADLADLNVPSKTYTLMAAACPILASVPEESAISDLVHQAGCGEVILPESPHLMAEKITALKTRPRLLEEMGQKGRDYLLNHLNRSVRTGQYYSLLAAVINEGK